MAIGYDQLGPITAPIELIETDLANIGPALAANVAHGRVPNVVYKVRRRADCAARALKMILRSRGASFAELARVIGLTRFGSLPRENMLAYGRCHNVCD